MNKLTTIIVAVAAAMFFAVAAPTESHAQISKIRITIMEYDSGCHSPECRNSDFRYTSGIKGYVVLIYPRAIVDQWKRDLGEPSPFGPWGIYVEQYQLRDMDETSLQKAFKALERNERVIIAVTRPMYRELNVPPGEYYVDYALMLKSPYRPVVGSGPPEGFTIWAPLEPGGRADWGPNLLSAPPGGSVDVRMTPTNNAQGVLSLHDVAPFVQYLIYNRRP